MADWADKEQLINEIEGQWEQSHDRLTLLDSYLEDAWTRHNAWYEDTDKWWAQRYILNALGVCQYVFVRIFAANHIFDPFVGIPYFLKYHTGGEVTWQAIVEAWVKDDFEGRAWTIGVIDRMRQILWDEPFDITWAARPEATKP